MFPSNRTIDSMAVINQRKALLERLSVDGLKQYYVEVQTQGFPGLQPTRQELIHAILVALYGADRVQQYEQS